MKHLLLFTAVLILTAASTFVKAQDTLPAGDNNAVPPMEIATNPIKTVLDGFLPDTVQDYRIMVQVKDDIDNSLTGCFSSYKAVGSPSEVINISIRRGELSFMAVPDADIQEEPATVGGYPAKVTTRMGGMLATLEISVNGKVVSFSYRGNSGAAVLQSFAGQFNYSIISSL
ncbi:MAG: hypothetical protein A2W84_14850 [Bacteroidetes bacterium GWC2_40_13]|nr:MAG: hypothetical protein A2W84_14850 [Bacteroidetes bacterium GWC2_40_13]HBX85071.1 hypothetical protein [Marinilabiliales bacterium]